MFSKDSIAELITRRSLTLNFPFVNRNGRTEIAIALTGDEDVQQGVSECQELSHQVSFHGVDAEFILSCLLDQSQELVELFSPLEKSLFLGQDHDGPPWCSSHRLAVFDVLPQGGRSCKPLSP